MQVKTIEKNIKAKLEEWLATITNYRLRDDVRENLLVSGGSITSMFLGEPDFKISPEWFNTLIDRIFNEEEKN